MHIQSTHNWRMALIVAAALPMLGCSDAAEEVVEAQATVEELQDGVMQITLIDIATKRLGIEFVELAENGTMLEAPYDVVLYDNFGKEWVYVSPEPNVYKREPIEIDHVEGETVYISNGPEAGTQVVTHGAAELLGIEAGVGQ
ncbi:MAG: hypothetical protein ACR2Q4_16345 [Geminicoccaceae bacterium]